MPGRPWAGALQGGGRRFNWWLKVGPFPWDGNPPYLIRLMSEKSTNRTPRKNGYWRFNQKLSLILIGSILGTLAIWKPPFTNFNYSAIRASHDTPCIKFRTNAIWKNGREKIKIKQTKTKYKIQKLRKHKKLKTPDISDIKHPAVPPKR